ncbi:MAG: hypothetical protein H6830_06155 [Planctomycetes bacterium]|nr:hypothetical protein [Planctomycetota bacterium]MCB9909104.1 hypothetical protein [Planctomycetota bacterium]MCB9911646.1 hypothetical protein [Planctomycetota bacterium]HPF14739.1 hypothetical protein [Planctomycetota bacterium]HRV80592.1 hypothetical protein [Planctomycetota bacterium]
MGRPSERDGQARLARGRRTCLVCYAPFRVERGVQACPVCGWEQSKQQQDRYWSREPGLVRAEGWLRVGALFATLGLGVALGFVMDASSLVWGLGLVAGLGGLTWYTAGCLTRRESFMDLRFLWPPLLFCIAVGPMVISLLLSLVGGGAPTGNLWSSGLVWALPWLVLFGLSLWIPQSLGRLRQARVGQAPREG